MVDGMSYLQLYYNKACTRELPKDDEGNYIYQSNTYSTNAINPLYINLWCKNNGSHTAYRTGLETISSDVTVSIPSEIPKILPKQVKMLQVSVFVPKGDNSKRDIAFRFNYDSI